MFVDRAGQEYGKDSAGEPFSAPPSLEVTLATGGSSLCLAPGLVWLKDWLSRTLCLSPCLWPLHVVQASQAWLVERAPQRKPLGNECPKRTRQKLRGLL